MELQTGEWGYKMAVGSARTGSASQQGQVHLCHQRHRQPLYCNSFMIWKTTKQQKVYLRKSVRHSKQCVTFLSKRQREKKKMNICFMSQRLLTTYRSGHAGFGCCSNTAHRLGKHHVLSTAEVPGNMDLLLLLPRATNYQTANPVTGSRLWPSWLCHSVQICIVTWRASALFLVRHPDPQNKTDKHNTGDSSCTPIYMSPHTHTHTQATPPPPSGQNESVAFFRPWAERDTKMTAWVFLSQKKDVQ